MAEMVRFAITWKVFEVRDGERLHQYVAETIEARSWEQAVASAEHSAHLHDRETYRIERLS